MKDLVNKIKRRLLKLRLRPIRVFCIHYVSDEYDPTTIWECDWMQTDIFKQNLLKLKEQGYSFISLAEAHKKLSVDRFRVCKYAVLTADDGLRMDESLYLWLQSQNIPITLFVCPDMLEGEKKREKPMPLLTHSELKTLTRDYAPLVTIGNHSMGHENCRSLSFVEFQENVRKSNEYLNQFEEYIPFFAYPCNKHLSEFDEHLRTKGITPVYADGRMNYNNIDVVHRELL